MTNEVLGFSLIAGRKERRSTTSATAGRVMRLTGSTARLTDTTTAVGRDSLDALVLHLRTEATSYQCKGTLNLTALSELLSDRLDSS